MDFDFKIKDKVLSINFYWEHDMFGIRLGNF